MLKKITLSFLIFSILMIPVLSVSALSFDMQENFNNWYGQKYFTSRSTEKLALASANLKPIVIIVNIINWALSFLGLAASGFILYGGLLWFTSRDNEEQLTKAKEIIKGAVIGMFIVLMSYGIAYLSFQVFTMQL